MVQISLKLARRNGAPADGKNGTCRDESDVTERMGDSSSDFAMTDAAPASVLELQHENREKTQQVQMLRETLSIIKVTMSRNDALLQEKIKMLDHKTSECEQLKIKCEGLVREKASAVAQWKKKYESLVAAQEAQTEQEATQRARAARPPSPDALLGILPKHPWRGRGTSALALSSRGSGPDQVNNRSDSEDDDDEDSIAAPSPLDAVFREPQLRRASTGSRSSRLSHSSRSSRSSKRTRKYTGKEELPTFAPLTMEWVTSAAPAAKQEGNKSVDSNKNGSVKDKEQEDATARVDIEEVVELPSVHGVSSDESSITQEVTVEYEEVSCEYEEVTVEEDYAEYEEEILDGSSITMESDVDAGCSSISSKEEDHKHEEFESMWQDDHESDDQRGLQAAMDAVDSTPASFEENDDEDDDDEDDEDEDDLIFSKHSLREVSEQEDYDDENSMAADAVEEQDAGKDEQQQPQQHQEQQQQKAATVAPAAVRQEEGDDNKSAISQDCEPVLDKREARLLRRKLRRRARIQRTAHKKSEQAGYEIVQVEC